MTLTVIEQPVRHRARLLKNVAQPSTGDQSFASFTHQQQHRPRRIMSIGSLQMPGDQINLAFRSSALIKLFDQSRESIHAERV